MHKTQLIEGRALRVESRPTTSSPRKRKYSENSPEGPANVNCPRLSLNEFIDSPLRNIGLHTPKVSKRKVCVHVPERKSPFSTFDDSLDLPSRRATFASPVKSESYRTRYRAYTFADKMVTLKSELVATK
jgi:hypothetical protein